MEGQGFKLSIIRPDSFRHTYEKIKEPFVAVSRDLLAAIPLGSYIELSDCLWAGKYKVMDKMGKRHTNTIDVFSKKKTEAFNIANASL